MPVRHFWVNNDSLYVTFCDPQKISLVLVGGFRERVGQRGDNSPSQRAPPLLLLAVSLTVFCSRGFLRNARMMDLSESCVLRVLQGVDRLEVEAIIWPALWVFGFLGAFLVCQPGMR